MRKRPTIADTAPRTAHRSKNRPSPEDLKARLRELLKVATKGETPEEIIAKGLALKEIKRLKPWKAAGLKGGFGSWAKIHLPYRAARANQYIRIAGNLTLDMVAGTNVCFEWLLLIAREPAHKRAQMVKNAANGASMATLRRSAQPKQKDPQTPEPDEKAGPFAQVLDLQEALCAALRKLTGQALPAEVLSQIRKGGEQLAQLHAGLCGTPDDPGGSAPPADPVKEEPKMDPPGSTSAKADADKGPAGSVSDHVSVNDLAGAALQLPPEVLALRPLFRFFHEKLTPGRKDVVQYTLVRIVEGADRRHYLNKMYRSILPFMYFFHPRNGDLSRLIKGVEAPGMAGRRFALYCLVAARLPGMPKRLLQLTEQDMEQDPKGGLGELVRYYRNLILGMS